MWQESYNRCKGFLENSTHTQAVAEHVNHFLGQEDLHSARAMALCNYAAFNSIDAVRGFRTMVENAPRKCNGTFHFQERAFAEVLAKTIRASGGATVYLGSISVSQA